MKNKLNIKGLKIGADLKNKYTNPRRTGNAKTRKTFNNEVIMPKERINMYLDRSRLELAQKKALERGVPISTAGNISELVRIIIDDYIDNKK